MKKLLTISDENISHLAEDIKAIISQARDAATMGMIAAKYMIGEAVATSPLYKKHGKNQSEFYEAIGREADMKSDTIADCVKLYEEYPKKNAKELAEKLYLEHGAWRNIRLALYGVVPNTVRNNEKKCDHCRLVEEAFRGEELIYGDWMEIKNKLHHDM